MGIRSVGEHVLSSGRSLRLFLVDGSPSGLITAEIMNWSGHVLTGPRSKLQDLLKRTEVRRTGVYFLVGPDPDAPSRVLLYVGETDEIGQRLVQHNKPEDKGGKDFWEKVCVVSSKDQNLTKAHVRYLESALIRAVREISRAKLINGTEPPTPLLPESDIADMDYFLEQIRVVLPVLGFEFLRSRPSLPPRDEEHLSSAVSPMFFMDIKRHRLHAEGREVDGEFVVLSGSKTRPEWASTYASYKSLYDQLVDDGVLSSVENGTRQFLSDYAFSSPSAAAAIVSGRPANGRTSWVVSGGGQTYADWQEQQIAESNPVVTSDLATGV